MGRQLSLLAGLIVLGGIILLPQHSLGQETIEARAAKACAGIAKQGSNLQGSFKVDDLTISGNANGTVTISKDGVNLVCDYPVHGSGPGETHLLWGPGETHLAGVLDQ
jgi:hypothetical protein